MANKQALAGLLVAVAFQAVAQEPLVDDVARIDAEVVRTNKMIELREANRKLSGQEILPQIMTIMADKGGASAQLLFASGLQRTVMEGDVVMDDIKVVSITSSSVQVTGKKGKTFLTFAQRQQQVGVPGAPGATGMLPPVPGGTAFPR